MEPGRLHLTGPEAAARCDENTIGVVAVLGSTMDGSYEPVAEIAAALDALQRQSGVDVPVHVDGASGGFVAPFLTPDLDWDFRLPRVASINTSGHKFGLVYPGVGWIIWRNQAALPDDLIFKVNYLGGEMPTFALNFSRPGSQVAAQYYNFIRLGFEGYRGVQLACQDVAMYLALGRLGPAGAGLPVGRPGRLHGVRPLRAPAAARLAAPRLYLPGEPPGHGGAPDRRAQRLLQGHGRTAPRRPAHAGKPASGGAAAACAAAAGWPAERFRAPTRRPCAAGRVPQRGWQRRQCHCGAL